MRTQSASVRFARDGTSQRSGTAAIPMQVAATLSVGERRWDFDETEWWILRRHWATVGPQSEAMARLFGTGGAIGREGVEDVTRFVASLGELAARPLVVGTDKYATISDWHRRWRELLQQSGVAFESHSSSGVAVFLGKTNLTVENLAARPDAHERLVPFESALMKCREVTALGRATGAIGVWLPTTYEGF
jgi:hypothetical protein